VDFLHLNVHAPAPGLIAVAFTPLHHVSKAEALFALIAGPVAMILSAVLGRNRRYWVYLFAIASAVIFFVFIVPFLPPDWNVIR
jgi:hypothetical protein